MPTADIKIQLGKGSLTDPPNPGGGNTWLQGKEPNASNGIWDRDSEYWYYYTGSNKPESKGKGGDVDITAPGNASIDVAPHDATEAIDAIVVLGGAPGAYSVEPPAVSSVWTIYEDVTKDPFGAVAYYQVYAHSVGPGNEDDGPIVMCDPIIRNRR